MNDTTTEQPAFTRKIYFRPAYDKRSTDPLKNYGIHNAEITFILTGKNGAVTFTLSTGWQLPHVEREFSQSPIKSLLNARGTNISYHSYVPVYEGQTSVSHCCWLDGKDCYCDGSSLSAEPIFDKLVAEGEEAVWRELEDWYASRLAGLTPCGCHI